MKIKWITTFVMAFLAMTSCDDNTDTLGNSLSNEVDKFAIITDTFNVSTRSIAVDSVLSRSSYTYLGHVKDPETNTYVTSNFSTQFGIAELLIESPLMPKLDSIVSRDAKGQIVADSCFFNIFFNSYKGDSLNMMKLMACELAKPISEGRDYYSNFNPEKEGYLRNDAGAIVKDKIYTFQGLIGTDSLRAVSIPLNDKYIDKEGNEYNNFGTYLMRKYYEDEANYKNSYNFIHNVFPGFFVKSTNGIGTMGEVLITNLQFHYRAYSNDSIVNAGLKIGGTEEVMQTTNIINDHERMKMLAADNTCTYLKSPAGIYTEVTLPIDDIKRNHENDTISSAKIVFKRLQSSDQGEFATPNYVLMVPKDSMYTFFEQRNLPDNVTSYIATFNSSYNTYTYNNISSLVNRLWANRGKSDDWNKVVLIPVTASISTTSNSSTYTKVSNDMELKSTRLVGGSANTHTPVTISVIYNKFSSVGN
ncbi:MAG: DUF4270 domain-containing protein [Prevotellaceae bacterium]|nr:DUF4270 domain-containing protein [Prevotellaceae bacterium]